MNIINILFRRKDKAVTNDKFVLMYGAYAPSQGGDAFWESYMANRRY
ncbi:MAG: hypothetical protein FWC76_03525 [Defluviitaleaceae bacterium]|nr:hypothetical protein [Defluviitaleaceae bacterium]